MAKPSALPVFADAVTSGRLSPGDFDHLWVEAGSMSSSGSYSQLELPRRGNVFLVLTSVTTTARVLSLFSNWRLRWAPSVGTVKS